MASEYKWRNQGGTEDDAPASGGVGVGGGAPRALPPLVEESRGGGRGGKDDDADKENNQRSRRRRRGDKGDAAGSEDGSVVGGSRAPSLAGSDAGGGMPSARGSARGARTGSAAEAGGEGGAGIGGTSSSASGVPRRRGGKTRASAKLEGGDEDQSDAGSVAGSRGGDGGDGEGSVAGSGRGGDTARSGRGGGEEGAGVGGAGGSKKRGASSSGGGGSRDEGDQGGRGGGERGIPDEKGAVIGRRQPEQLVLPTVHETDLAGEDEVLTVQVGGEVVDSEEADQANNILFVETGTGRAFKRKKRDKDEEKVDTPSDRSSDTDRNLKAFLDLIASFTASAFIFCQGVLGGVSLILFYLLVRMDDTSFMRVYSPIAADGQKAFLFLSTVSFVAALDKWTKDQMASWHLRGSALKAVDALTVLMYSICFIFTLVCTPLEDVMHSSHLRVSEWYRWNLTSDFVAQYATWKAMHGIRCVFGILGWMFSAWETRNYLNNAPNKPLHDIYEKVMRQGASIS